MERKRWVITVKRLCERRPISGMYINQAKALHDAELVNYAHPELDAKVEEYKEEKK